MQTVMSALPPIADMCSATSDVRFVPSDIATSSRRFNGNEMIGCSRLANTPARPCRETQHNDPVCGAVQLPECTLIILCPQQRIGGTLHTFRQF